MKQKQESEPDRLIEFLNSVEIAKAPEGFTDKLMTKILIKPLPVLRPTLQSEKSVVPYISAGIAILFILIALLLPGMKSTYPTFKWTGNLEKISSLIPDIKLTWTLSISFPEIMAYVTVSVFLLLIFDRSISRYFYQET